MNLYQLFFTYMTHDLWLFRSAHVTSSPPRGYRRVGGRPFLRREISSPRSQQCSHGRSRKIHNHRCQAWWRKTAFCPRYLQAWPLLVIGGPSVAKCVGRGYSLLTPNSPALWTPGTARARCTQQSHGTLVTSLNNIENDVIATAYWFKKPFLKWTFWFQRLIK